MSTPRILWLAVALVVALGPAWAAKVELSTLPPRDDVQIVIYRDVDLTFVRERRQIQFREGKNDIAFSWADTKIDPTSVEMTILGDPTSYHLEQVSYPPEQPNVMVWHIQAEKPALEDIEVSYFTSGLYWSASYQLALDQDEMHGRLTAYFDIANSSGETYENAEISLVTGGVRLLESVETLSAAAAQPLYSGGIEERQMTQAALKNVQQMRARGQFVDEKYEQLGVAQAPAGAIGPGGPAGPAGAGGQAGFGGPPGMAGRQAVVPPGLSDVPIIGELLVTRRPEISGAALADYHAYLLSEKVTIPQNWSTRVEYTTAPSVAVDLELTANVSDTIGRALRRYEFVNSEENALGEAPLPAGPITVFRKAGNGQLTYIGQSTTEYAGMGEKVTPTLGSDPHVFVEQAQTNYEKTEYAQDKYNRVSSYREIYTYKTTVSNFKQRNISIKVRGEEWTLEPGETKSKEWTTSSKHNFIYPNPEEFAAPTAGGR